MSSTLSSSDRIPAERNQDAEADRNQEPAKTTRADAAPVQRRLLEEAQGFAASAEPAHAVQKKQAAGLIEELCTNNAMTKSFIASALIDDARRALTLFRSWNSSYEEVERLMKAKEESSGPVKASNKRKAGQSTANKGKAVFAPVTWDEVGTSAEEMVRKFQSDTRRAAEHERKEKKTKREYLTALEYNGENYSVKILSDGGGYYDVYDITDDKKIHPQHENRNLVLRIPKSGPDSQLAGQGMRSHGQLSSKRVPVPQVHNNARRDGFFLVEKIAHQFDPEALAKKPGLQACTPQEQQRLLQIQGVLQNNARAGQPEVPDFRPNNLRFRDPNSNEVVLVDFSDEADLGKMQGDEFWANMKGILREFCSSEDHWLYQFLIENFSAQQKQALERAREF